jgi:hypothetical protein
LELSCIFQINVVKLRKRSPIKERGPGFPGPLFTTTFSMDY